MASLLWLPDALRKGGCKVWEDPEWRQRSHGSMGEIRGVVGHHTAGGGANDWLVVRNGRTGLAGPLAQLTVERDGTWRVLASGQAWHAGSGGPWRDVPAGSGNTHLIGIEGVSSGRVPGDWTPAQRESYPRGVAALLRHLGFGPDRFLFHKTWAPGRKIDIAGWPGDLEGFRADVARWMTTTPARQQEDAMTPEDRAYLDARFTDLWGRWGVRQDEAGVWRDRLTDLWDELVAIRAAASRTAGPATVLSDADVDRIAAAVVALLGAKTSA